MPDDPNPPHVDRMEPWIPLSELTAEEIVALVHLANVAESHEGLVLVAVGDKMTTLDGVPGMESLARKINEAGKREDVQNYMTEVYGNADAS